MSRRHLVRLVHDTIFTLGDRGCRRARAPFSAGAADPSWGEHPINTALAAENVAVTARCRRTAACSRWAQPGWPGIQRGESGMRASEQDLTIEMQVGDIVTRGRTGMGSSSVTSRCRRGRTSVHCCEGCPATCARAPTGGTCSRARSLFDTPTAARKVRATCTTGRRVIRAGATKASPRRDQPRGPTCAGARASRRGARRRSGLTQVAAMGDDPLAGVRVAFAHHDWQRAFDEAASAVTPIELEATRVDLMAEAAWWLGRLDGLHRRTRSAPPLVRRTR